MAMELSTIERRFVQAVWNGSLQKEAAVDCGITLIQSHHVVRALKKRFHVPTTAALLRRLVREGVLQP